MIEFESYRRNASAPTIYVNKVNGVYRLDTALIRVCFGYESVGPGGSLSNEEAANLLWEPNRWMENGSLFRWVMKEFEAGGLRQAVPDDGGGRRPRTQ